MSLSKDVHLAAELAAKAHSGQVDKAGVDYIDHPRRVASRLDSDELKVVGWLHDVLEDTDVTEEEIERLFGKDTLNALKAVTHREGESWDDYIERVKSNEVSTKVKISDLIDNSNLSRLPVVTLKDVERQKKYNRTLEYLIRQEGSLCSIQVCTKS